MHMYLYMYVCHLTPPPQRCFLAFAPLAELSSYSCDADIWQLHTRLPSLNKLGPKSLSVCDQSVFVRANEARHQSHRGQQEQSPGTQLNESLLERTVASPVCTGIRVCVCVCACSVPISVWHVRRAKVWVNAAGQCKVSSQGSQLCSWGCRVGVLGADRAILWAELAEDPGPGGAPSYAARSAVHNYTPQPAASDTFQSSSVLLLSLRFQKWFEPVLSASEKYHIDGESIAQWHGENVFCSKDILGCHAHTHHGLLACGIKKWF